MLQDAESKLRLQSELSVLGSKKFFQPTTQLDFSLLSVLPSVVAGNVEDLRFPFSIRPSTEDRVSRVPSSAPFAYLSAVFQPFSRCRPWDIYGDEDKIHQP